MCRWLACTGSPVTLDTLLLKPTQSLIDQSLRARRLYVPGPPLTAEFGDHSEPTNGDGFGVGWYGGRDLPDLCRDVRPTGNDANLHRLAAQVRSGMFLAPRHRVEIPESSLVIMRSGEKPEIQSFHPVI